MIEPFKSPIYVTRPYLPDLKAYQAGLAEIWQNQWLTNNGPVLQRYVKHLEAFFGTSNVCAFNNGTLALQIALQGMKIEGEVITTPFTFVATAHCLVWNNIRPVFVDIDPVTYTISPEAVEAAITPRTTAILAVHVFGTPCHLDALQRIADKYHLALIYDAAHAFGVKIRVQGSGFRVQEEGGGGQRSAIGDQRTDNGSQGTDTDNKAIRQSGSLERSANHSSKDESVSGNNAILRDIGLYGDCSMFSLHSTKLYHSIEGGLLTFKDPADKKVFEYLRNFGFENETEVMMVGTNAKMNEMQALMGDMMLPELPAIIAKRRRLTEAYVEGLQDVPGVDMHGIQDSLKPPCAVIPNFAYIPVEITADYGLSRDGLYERLKTFNVFARRYFYPLLTDFSCYKASKDVEVQPLPVARNVADRIVTLPIYCGLEVEDVERICAIIKVIGA